jgi:hypothetical protein
MRAARLFPEPAAGEPYTILIMSIGSFEILAFFNFPPQALEIGMAILKSQPRALALRTFINSGKQESAELLIASSLHLGLASRPECS